jgi:hypothetical protein
MTLFICASNIVGQANGSHISLLTLQVRSDAAPAPLPLPAAVDCLDRNAGFSFRTCGRHKEITEAS